MFFLSLSELPLQWNVFGIQWWLFGGQLVIHNGALTITGWVWWVIVGHCSFQVIPNASLVCQVSFNPRQTVKVLSASLSNDAVIELEGKGAWDSVLFQNLVIYEYNCIAHCLQTKPWLTVLWGNDNTHSHWWIVFYHRVACPFLLTKNFLLKVTRWTLSSQLRGTSGSQSGSL